MIIEYFRIEIKPWLHHGTYDRMIEIEVQINGQKYYHKKILGPDDLSSMFDRLFDEAKEEIKKAISDQQEPAQGQ